MKCMLTFGVLLLVALGHAQQQGQFPNGTSANFSGNCQDPMIHMSPDQNAPRMSTAQVKEKIQERLISEPALSNTTLDVMADERSIVLIGTVNTEKQRNLTLRIARAYAGDRKVIDKIGVRQQK